MLDWTFDDGQHVILFHDEVILAVKLDLLARIRAEQDPVARFDVELPRITRLLVGRRASGFVLVAKDLPDGSVSAGVVGERAGRTSKAPA